MAEIQTGIVTDLILPAALAIIMFGVGLSLTLDDYRRIRRAPLPVAVGLLTQCLLLPAVAIVVGLIARDVFHLSTVLLMGLLLLASCPGGTTSNLVTYLARADAALSVTVTSVNSLFAAITTPLTFLLTTTLVLGNAASVSVSFVEMAGLVLVMVVLPMVIGMEVRHYAAAWALRLEPKFRIVSIVIFGIVVAGAVLQNREALAELAARVLPMVVLLNVAVLAASLGVARVIGLHRKQQRAVAIETAFQNGTLGIALAVGQLGSPEAAIVPGFYSLAMFATGGAVAWWWARDEKQRAEATPPVVDAVESSGS